ncbi:transmembrane protein 203-like [Hetaerina americana]|uniref:transmembrane protein 203-like n=1 Tax=Hetaerina americana TaxID=62018 RepID=UPI003A7F46C6
MFFSLDELVQWLGLTVFEMWVFLASLSLFTILVALGAEGALPPADPPIPQVSGSQTSMHRQPSPWLIFSPLFVADALNTYFCAIVFVRMYLEGAYKAALLRASWSLSLLVLLFVFKFLLCEKLSGRSTLEYSEVLAPIFILLQLVAVRACHLH